MNNEAPSSFLPIKREELEPLGEVPGEVLQENLLNLFCKTRTNYSTLVPKIFQVMEAFRQGGPENCPVPVFHHFSTLLQEKTILSLEKKEADGESMGFLALCTERKAVRSGGGGKYYFLSSNGRLVGCSKSDLHSRKQEARVSPVLLKNLVFLFLMHQETDVCKIDPRARSSNPQRLLDFYESLQAVGKEQTIRRLLKVWSMEVVCDEGLSKGFPYCSVLWIKDLDIEPSLAKWRGSTSGQQRFQFLPPSPDHQLSFPAFSGRIAADPFPANYTPFNSFLLGPPAPSDLRLGAPLDALELFRNYQVASEFLSDADMHGWCSTIVQSLSPKTVLAAASVLESILRIQIVMSQSETSEADPELTRQLLFGFANKAQKPELISVLRVLLACLLREQQQPEATLVTDIPEYLFSVQ